MRTGLPKDAYAMIAVTMTDLYPKESWNFVFGSARLRHRVGVFSFARYHPSFRGDPVDENTPAIVFERSAKVLIHEMGHMFGIKHCIHYECIMNGSNHLAESDRKPFHLCPVCLRKMHWGLRSSPKARYEKLATFYQAEGLADEAEWIGARLKRMSEK